MDTIYARESRRYDSITGWQTVTEYYRNRDDCGPMATDPFPSRLKPTQKSRKTVTLNCYRYRVEWLTGEKVIWGMHPAHDHLTGPIKLAAYTPTELKRREADGWTCQVCAAGEEPDRTAFDVSMGIKEMIREAQTNGDALTKQYRMAASSDIG